MRTCWAQYLLWGLIVLFGFGAILTGCGQKGPLYLPDEEKHDLTTTHTQNQSS